MDAAVTWLLQPEQVNITGNEVAFYCLEADVKAHGLSGTPDATDVRQINQSGLVELVRLHPHCLSWK